MDIEATTKDVTNNVQKHIAMNAINQITATIGVTDQPGPSSSKGTSKKVSIKTESGTKEQQPSSIRLDFLSAVELQVFKTFVKNYVNTRELRREDAIALNFVFGPTIQQVFEMVEEEHITIRQSQLSRRVLVEVCGKSGDIYWIPPGHSFCQCMAYVHGKKEYCKHVLAAHLYLAITPKSSYKPISDDELSTIYKECLEDTSSANPK